jgi:hypothetical protein
LFACKTVYEPARLVVAEKSHSVAMLTRGGAVHRAVGMTRTARV